MPSSPRSLSSPQCLNILLGFVFPVQTRQVVYFVLGIELLFAQTGMATISVTLGGIAMGYLLTTGMATIGLESAEAL